MKNDNLHEKQFIFTEYEITYDNIHNSYLKGLPKKVQNEIKDLHNLSISEPEKAIPKLESLISKYPKVNFLYNFLSCAYNNTGDIENANRVLLDNYKRNPNYLFAKINYAQLCLENNELDKIPRIFNQKYDLKMLYPNRNKFHISEYVGFAGVLGEYFFRIGKKDTAKIYYNTLRKIAPRHPLTKRLKMLLKPSLFHKMIFKLLEHSK